MAEPETHTEVPHTALSPETLRRLVEEFVSRDGTDYGRAEKTLEQKAADVMRQLRRGEVRIVLEHRSGTVNIVPAAGRSGGRSGREGNG